MLKAFQYIEENKTFCKLELLRSSPKGFAASDARIIQQRDKTAVSRIVKDSFIHTAKKLSVCKRFENLTLLSVIRHL